MNASLLRGFTVLVRVHSLYWFHASLFHKCLLRPLLCINHLVLYHAATGSHLRTCTCLHIKSTGNL